MRTIRYLVLWFVGCVSLTQGLYAQNARNDSIVTRSVRGRDVLEIHTGFDRSSMVASTGLARVSIQASRPSPIDRELTVVLYVKAYTAQHGEAFAYRKTLRLSEGATSAEVEIPHLCYENHMVWDVGIFEDGQDIEDKQPTLNNGPNWLYYEGQQRPVLVVTSAGEDEAQLREAIVAQTKLSDPQFDSQLPSTITGQSLQIGHVQNVDQASDDWRAYYAYVYVALTPATLRVINEQPAVANALRQSILAGGNLLVHGVNDPVDWEPIDQLVAGLPVGQSSQRKDAPQSSTEMETEWASARAPIEPTFQEPNQSPSTEPIRDPVQGLAKHRALQRSLGFGELLVSSSALGEIPAEKFPLGGVGKITASNPTGQASDGNWFWRNLIRAVGKPPVWMFCAMVTLFGALLGPGLLWMTGRIQRRSLMIFLVPAISLVATGAIIAYSIFSEGFETHVRITSVQFLDSQIGSGFAWSRQNYFSGIPPREGLTFSRQAYARPVYAESLRRWNSNSDPRRGLSGIVDLLPDRQVWTNWLGPRQQQQLLVGHPLSKVDLPIAVARQSAESVMISNRTESRLPIILIRGAASDYYLARDLAAGEQIVVTAEEASRVAPKVALSLGDYRPEEPPELGEGGSLLDFGNRAQSSFATAGGGELDDVLNRTFKRWLSDKFRLPPFGFAVLATESTAIEVPLQGISNENLHLIVGVEPW